jgi:3-phenylpropionate/cinnamic acid dioxygenase small subunit
MALAADDRLAIHELISLHGHLMDERQFSRLDELLTDDAVYDLEDFGAGIHRGMAQLRALVTSPGDHPVGHHVSNVVVTEGPDGTVRVRSKGIGVRADGTSGSVVYDDVVVKTPAGWRLKYRAVIGRRG